MRPGCRSRLSGAALLLAMFLPGSMPLHASPVAVMDFLIQDVCTDAQGRAVGGDPATCDRHRDLRPLERVPYLRTDNEAGLLYLGITAHPVLSPYPSRRLSRVAVPKEFGGDDIATAFRDFDPCAPGACTPRFRDGYDILEAEGDFVSIVGTSDPGLNDQVFWRAGCWGGIEKASNTEDSWLVFPTDIFKRPSGAALARLQITQGTRCPWFFNEAYTEWRMLPQKVTFTTGKRLEAIRSDHFGGRSPARADHIERFYFTREYGFTRWERWETGAVTTKFHGCNGPTEQVRDGVSFRRTDCRDFTHIVPQAVPFLPDVLGPPWPLNGAPNLVTNGTFAAGDLDGWTLRGAASAELSGLSDRNTALALACGASCAGVSAGQDVDVPAAMRASRQRVRFGGVFGADGPARLMLRLTLRDAGGRKIRQVVRSLAVGPGLRAFDLEDAVAFSREGVATVRLELVPESPGRRHLADEVYLIAWP